MGTVLRHVRADHALIALLTGVAAIGAGTEAAVTLAPVLGQQFGGGGSAGWVTSSFGLGGLLGVAAHGLLRRRLSPSTEGMVAMLLLAASLAVAGTISSPAVLVVALVTSGAGSVLGTTALSVGIQLRSPEAMLGRIMAIWIIAFCGARPIAAVVLGLTAEYISTTVALIEVAVLLLAASVVVLTFARGDRLAGRSAASDRSPDNITLPV